jgi:glycosyltransferase involved in cell wall biosynthesis
VRIVHVASGREWRGGQRQVWLLTRELHALGIEQTVVTSRRSRLADRLSSSGVHVREVSWTVGLDPRVIPAVLGELRRPALLHAHDAHALTLAGICSWITGSSYVATRRVTFPLRNPYLWRRACRIIAISGAVKHALVHDGLDPSRVVLVPSACDPSAADPSPIDIRTRLNLPPGGQLAVALGALTPEKDHLTLVRAAFRLVRDLPELHWVIVGQGKMEQRIRREIEQLHLNGRVHLMAWIEDPHQVLGQADLFVLSSRSEGLGSSILAAMARGIPVVATRVGGVPELLESGAGLLVDPADPEQLADAVKRVLAEPSLQRSLVTKAKEELGKYRPSAMAERVLSVYRSCAHSLDGA